MNTANYNNATDYTTGSNVQLILSGKSYFDLLLQIIEAAKKVLHLQFYIFLNDQTGTSVMEALKAAARRNVAVFLHIDSYASKELPQECINDMRAAGVQVKQFEPVLRSRHFYFGRRLHHKVVVADGFYSLVGGINVCDRYNDMPGEPAWLDMALYCEGNASYTTENICNEMWNRKIFFSPVKNRVTKKNKKGNRRSHFCKGKP